MQNEIRLHCTYDILMTVCLNQDMEYPCMCMDYILPLSSVLICAGCYPSKHDTCLPHVSHKSANLWRSCGKILVAGVGKWNDFYVRATCGMPHLYRIVNATRGPRMASLVMATQGWTHGEHSYQSTHWPLLLGSKWSTWGLKYVGHLVLSIRYPHGAWYALAIRGVLHVCHS